MKKKKIAVLGSTGSIGVQALKIIKEFSEDFELSLISANSSYELLLEQALFFQPKHVIINTENGYAYIKQSLESPFYNFPITKLHLGNKALCDLIEYEDIDIVLVAIVGFAALLPTISAIKSGKKIALANKETLVVAGQIISSLVEKHNGNIIPVDSEHSAIFQCVQGESFESVKNIILTASGGPFRGYSQKELENVSLKNALKHPNWEMGAKITIDSATLMNKGFELIETRWLFDVSFDKIKVVVHPESIIHSLVEFQDGSVIAQLGEPSMYIPILYALNFPKRVSSSAPKLDLIKIKSLNFEEPNKKVFRHLDFAYEAIKFGGSYGCVLNASNEVAVSAFLKEKIRFIDMIKIIEKSIEKITFVQNPNLEDLLEIDLETRKFANSII
jgi:1-deoxy-D-xylulose-5-phosphate reductoisomerase